MWSRRYGEFWVSVLCALVRERREEGAGEEVRVYLGLVLDCVGLVGEGCLVSHG
jgi:hypothetical protein